MCRNIKTLFNFEPPATESELRAAALQYVRKLSGLNAPSKVNEAAFAKAVKEITTISQQLMAALVPNAHPKNREQETAKAKLRSAKRFGRSL